MKKIAIFASGSGTNAQNIVEYFRREKAAIVSLILSNKRDAYVLQRAEDLEVPYTVFNRNDFYNSNRVLEILKDHQIDLIVLAGFLWLIPENILRAYPNCILNVHPALLPDYGGKGMYGNKVHEAVIRDRRKESGISIHYVNEKYDEGEIIFQARSGIAEEDTPDSLAKKIHELEYKHYPRVVHQVIRSLSANTIL